MVRRSSKPKLKLLFGKANHFVRWEIPAFERYFQLVDKPGKDVILFAFGPDVFETATEIPALRRIALLFPGFNFSPYYVQSSREEALATIKSSYDLVFVNPGPIHEALKDSVKIAVCPFSLDTKLIKFKYPRKTLNSLLHLSADYPQKDWRRSESIMKLTRLPYEVFPPRVTKTQVPTLQPNQWFKRMQQKCITLGKKAINHVATSVQQPHVFMPSGYRNHHIAITKYQQYDGFVHVAAETPPSIDGKYTASLLEAGLTGAILFWHDTLKLGNDFETIFDLPVDPAQAAKTILEIRKNINIERHSQLTQEEIFDRCNPDRVMKLRFDLVRQLL